MKEYKYIGTEEQLVKHGFYLCKDTKNNIEDKDYLRDVDDYTQVYISLFFSGYDKKVMNNFDAEKPLNTKYFQDLIDAGLVEEIDL